MVRKIILMIMIFAFHTIFFDQSYGGQLNLPPPHSYGVPQILDGIEKGSERRRQKKREQELYQQHIELQEQRAKHQLELQEQRSKQKQESLIFDLIVDKASRGKMNENDKKYLEKHMGYGPANILWDFNESNK